jgi:putative tributyrin esterase
MSLCHIHWSSDVLQKQVSTYVILPDRGPGPFPVFYLLHGLSDDYTIWLRRTRIDVYAAWFPMIIVMPDGGRGFYTNNYQGPRWADHLALELPDFIERTFPARKDRAGRCIGGLSMGGYGAMRLGLGHADRYASINSHSGALRTLTATRDVLPPDEFARIFGPVIEGTENDLLHLAKKAKSQGNLPPIRIDCGTEDFLLEENRLLHRQLTDANIPHEYAEFPGYHNWDYWEIHIQEALRFHAKNLGIQKP